MKQARRWLGVSATVVAALVPVASAHAVSPSAVVKRVNTIRAQHGLSPLRISRALDRAAIAHSAEMAANGTLTHASAAGSLGVRLRRYTRAATFGETIAWMPTAGAAQVVTAWMNSPPHRAVLLSRRFHRIGVGARGGNIGGQRGTSFTADLAG